MNGHLTKVRTLKAHQTPCTFHQPYMELAITVLGGLAVRAMNGKLSKKTLVIIMYHYHRQTDRELAAKFRKWFESELDARLKKTLYYGVMPNFRLPIIKSPFNVDGLTLAVDSEFLTSPNRRKAGDVQCVTFCSNFSSGNGNLTNLRTSKAHKRLCVFCRPLI